MTLDEAIKHCKEKEQEQALNGCFACAEEHKQLAEWLTQLKEIQAAYESDYNIQDLIETCVKFWG